MFVAPGRAPARPVPPYEPPDAGRERLRVALLTYRGNPRSGGQGVYVRFLSRELARLGHQVTVFSGQPWPVLDQVPGVDLVKVPSLDLYREPDPFRLPRLRELRSGADLAELATMLSGGFPEPRTFSLRLKKVLAGRRRDFDVVHDNQSFGTGLLELVRAGWPVIGTCHHPVTVDRLVDLAHAGTSLRRLSMHRWYGFVGMQNRVARRLQRILTVSYSSRRDIVEQMGVAPERIAVVPVGADVDLFRPPPTGRARVPGRIMTTASADVPLKGLAHLLEALAKLRTELPEAHLVVVGEPRPGSAAAQTLERLGLEGAVSWRPGVQDPDLVDLYWDASVVVVPSLYEGFSLPAVEAMACEAPLVASTGGALPEVVGPDGEAALLVRPADPGALAAALGKVLSEPAPFAARLGRAGRRRVLARYTWARCAEGAVAEYRSMLSERVAQCPVAAAPRPIGAGGGQGASASPP
ncbi:MAG TPA: glycosyltransferase family 4 protein [Acidimicrobiales bacterium]|nr:glycosyltransferase family 4 protein [Acidimicrobiales bacterium]